MLCLLNGCLLMLFSFSRRLNGQGINIHNWCWWTIFLLSAWISKHFYLQKENWYLTKTIPGSLCCRDRKSDTRLSIWDMSLIGNVWTNAFFAFCFFQFLWFQNFGNFFLFWGFFLKFTQEKRISDFFPKKILSHAVKIHPKN